MNFRIFKCAVVGLLSTEWGMNAVLSFGHQGLLRWPPGNRYCKQVLERNSKRLAQGCTLIHH